MNPPQHIWLIRHGETAWSRTGQHTGWSDIPLLPEGEAQAAALAPQLAGHRFALVLTSPLCRAQKTAQLAGLSQAQPDPDLREWNYGLYEGKTLDDIRQEAPGWTIWTGAVPGGETLDQVAARAQRVVNRARSTPGDVALIAHGHILRVLTACWLNLPPAQGQHFALSTATISELGYENDQPALWLWNATSVK